MKQFRTYRIITISLAFMMLFTSMGFAVDMHYCKGELKNVQLFGKAKACHEKATTCSSGKPCPLMQKMQAADEDGCCSNQLVFADFDEDINPAPSVKNTLELEEFSALPLSAKSLFQANLKHIANPYLNYKPPLLCEDIPILVQSFLL